MYVCADSRTVTRKDSHMSSVSGYVIMQTMLDICLNIHSLRVLIAVQVNDS